MKNGSREELQPLYVTATRIADGQNSIHQDSKPTRLHLSASYFTNLHQDAIFRTSVRNLMYILTWYVLSTTLSMYNKKIVGREHGLFGKGSFPAPLFMSGVQFFFQTMLAKMVLNGGLVQRQQPRNQSWTDWVKRVLPNGLVTGLDISFSNKSLVLISMSFYTMCKSTTPVFLLLFAFIWRIERPQWSLAGVIVTITIGLIILVAGEMGHEHFEIWGFILVMTASCLAGLRFTLTQVLLHGGQEHGSLGGPLEVMEQLTPIMSGSVLFISFFWERLWSTLPASPWFANAAHSALTMFIIAAGAVIAFLMVWAEFKVIQETSALTFIIAGTVKEVVVVIAAIIIMGETFTFLNGVGLSVVMLGVALFNFIKYQKIKQGEAPLTRSTTRPTNKEDDDDAEDDAEMNGRGLPYQPLVDSAAGRQQRPLPERESMLQLEAMPMLTSGIMVHRS